MKLKALPVVLVLLFGLFATSVLAVSERSAAVRKNVTGTGTLIATASATPKVRGKSNLIGARLKACEAKANGITKKLAQLTKLVVKMEGTFDAIALRVENFYETKVVPSGKSLPNYSNLVADIAAKKALVDAALTKAQSLPGGFSCTEGDPKGLLKDYRTEMQAVKQALGDYRKSIRNLIVGVHTLVPTTTGTGTPEGSATPAATTTSSATPTAIPTSTPSASPVASPATTPTVSPTASPTI